MRDFLARELLRFIGINLGDLATRSGFPDVRMERIREAGADSGRVEAGQSRYHSLDD